MNFLLSCPEWLLGLPSLLSCMYRVSNEMAESKANLLPSSVEVDVVFNLWYTFNFQCKG